jgi:hypothetical protein
MRQSPAATIGLSVSPSICGILKFVAGLLGCSIDFLTGLFHGALLLAAENAKD